MLATVRSCVGEDLARVERLFDEELRSDLQCVNQLTRHVSRFRGKMLRPTLLLLTARAVGRVEPAHITLATVVEMVHMATLVHDDVLDDAEMRRKGATINHLRGNEAAVLLGDFLISHAFHLCSSLESQFASRFIGQTTNRVCEGELLQNANRANLDLTEETYFQIIRLKTAALIGACGLLGAKFAGAGPDVVEAMRTFGESLGIAFQVQDDLLDLLGDPHTVGKTLGQDIEKSKLTLPLIHFLHDAPREHRSLLRSLLRGGEPDKVEKIRNLILPSRSIAYARDAARVHIDRARAALAVLPSGEAASVLASMAEFVISREV